MTFQTGMETGGESWLFWRESVWLPPNMTWADVTPVEGVARYTRCVLSLENPVSIGDRVRGGSMFR